MEKRGMKAWAMSVAMVAGAACGEAPKPAHEDTEIVLAGTGGSGGEAGTGGSATQAGGAGTGTAGSGSLQACDPPKPTEGDTDAGWIEPVGETMDAGVEVVHADADAGVDSPEPTNQDPPDDAGTGSPSVTRAPLAGELVFTELMPDPTVLSDTLGEWIEIHNPTVDVLDLAGCVLSDDSRDRFVIETLAVAPGGYVVLGRSEMAASRVDLVYGGVVLTNTEDEVVLTCAETMIDRVAYGAGFPRPAGRAMQLDSRALSASLNDQASSWCAGVEGGTPGAANAECPAE